MTNNTENTQPVANSATSFTTLACHRQSSPACRQLLRQSAVLKVLRNLRAHLIEPVRDIPGHQTLQAGARTWVLASGLIIQAAENACLPVSHALNDNPWGISHAQQKDSRGFHSLCHWPSSFLHFWCPSFMISSMQLLMFSRLSFVSHNQSRTPVNILVPAIFATMAMQAFNGTAILLIVITLFFSVKCFDHNSTPTAAIVFCNHPNTHVPLSIHLYSSLSQL